MQVREAAGQAHSATYVPRSTLPATTIAPMARDCDDAPFAAALRGRRRLPQPNRKSIGGSAYVLMASSAEVTMGPAALTTCEMSPVTVEEERLQGGLAKCKSVTKYLLV